MRKTLSLTAQEEKDLLRHSRSRNTIIHRRARIVLLSSQGRSSADIGVRCGLHPKTVREVIRRFKESGLDSILPRKKTGRPKEFDSKIQDKLIELVRKKPEEFGIESGVWTLKSACGAAVSSEIVKSIGKESLRRILKDNMLSWKRVKNWIAPSDPAYEEKKAKRDRIVERVLSHPDWDAEYTDESWLVAQTPDGVMNPQGGSSWSDVGEPKRVPTSNKKSRITTPMYAGVSVKDGGICWRFAEKVNTEETIGYLSFRAKESKSRGLRRLFIIWDNASWHVSKGLRGWLIEHNKKARKEGGVIISLVLLPKRSPWLNPIEAVFRWLKQKAIFCRIHENQDQLKDMAARCMTQQNQPTDYQLTREPYL